MRPYLKTLLMLIWLPLMITVTTIPWLLKWEAGRRFCSMLAFKGLNRILGLRVHVQGTLSAKRPLMLVCNHSSYIDILALGNRLPVAFTPKKEIARWPVIGFCSKLAGCVFVERTPKAIAATKGEIAKRLATGRVMCIFAEGTTNNGTDLKPFKSSLFSLAEGTNIAIQPAALHYSHRNGAPLDAQGRAKVAWYDDMSLLPHLWQLLRARRIDAQLQILPLLEQTGDRKALCSASEVVIRQALEQKL
jgi:1-acyl-sn-glycerol-3-phosphate acyltransferase